MRHRWTAAAVAMTTALSVSGLALTPAFGADDPLYHLPVPEGTALIVSQGNDRGAGRRGGERYAFDFVAGEGTERRFAVAAARGGTVLAQRSNVRGGRCNDRLNGPRPACWTDVNYVLIDHGDGTSGLYMHLRRGDALVTRGDVVAAGEVIGHAGSSGWTDEVGVQFQVQRTPYWHEWGGDGWFVTESVPVGFADPSVVELTGDGVPISDDEVVSANADPIREPFRFERRPVDLPALVPLEIGEERDISRAYDADSPDGFGLHFAPLVMAPDDASDPDPDEPGADPADPLEPPLTDPGTAVRPLFGGELEYAGCAAGPSASLGRIVIVRRTLDEGEYLAVHGNLSDIDPFLLDADPDEAVEVGPNDVIGHFGVILGPDETPTLTCPSADDTGQELYAGILVDAFVFSDGEIVGGTPVSPEPLLGRAGYEGFVGWSGPVQAERVGEDPGRPRANWTRRTPRHSSHIPFGDRITLSARVRDAADVQELRFRAYHPAWPRQRASQRFDSFDPRQSWRIVAVCRPPGAAGVPRRARGCDWDGDANDAVVSFQWDPTVVEDKASAPWLPRSRQATGARIPTCVPVSLGLEVIDTAGHVRSNIEALPSPARCDQRGVDRSDIGRVIYLDPFVPPVAPGTRGKVEDRGWPPIYAPDPLDGAIVWRDRSTNEDGFYIYARRSWFLVDCSIAHGSWRRIQTLGPDTQRYRPRHNRVIRTIPVPEIPDVPGSLSRWEYAVSAFNEAGQSSLVPVGGFVGGSEAFCDPGLVPPPDL